MQKIAFDITPRTGFNHAPYGGFINPVFQPVMQGDKIIDVKVEYPDNFSEQMLYYSNKYSFLPTYN